MDRKKQLALWRQMPEPKPDWESFKRMRGPDDLLRWMNWNEAKQASLALHEKYHRMCEAKQKANQAKGTSSL